MRKLAALLSITALLCLAAYAEAHTAPIAPKPAWMSTFAYRVAVCESRFNPRLGAQYRHAEYGGAWGWYVGTWNLDRYSGMPRLPWEATLREQYRVVLRSFERRRHFGCVDMIGGYRTG